MVCPRARVVVAMLLFARAPAVAQGNDNRLSSPPQILGGIAEDRRRISQLLGGMSPSGGLILTASSSTDTTPALWTRPRFAWIRPSATLTWNSAIAFSMNDGAEWAGRGVSASIAGGIQAQIGRIWVNLAPQVWHTENRPFAVLPGGDTSRSGFASPWHTGLISADLPTRFGYRPITSVDLGESAAWFTARGVAVGVSTESQWWGPGIRNSLIMSNNAGGIPHAFLRSAAPVQTRAGTFEGRWIIGELSESRFFDSDSRDDARSLSGVVATFSPAFEPSLTLGWSRVVYSNIAGAGALPAHAFDALRRWQSDQLSSLFARWVFPNSGAEAYGEWGRILLPRSLRGLLVAPQFTQGFTLGFQWLPELKSPGRLRLQAELTNLEQSPTSRAADTLSFYTSKDVPQGYTQRGQVIGAAIGPGSSSQWLALDYLLRTNSAGVFVGRVRWDTDAYYLQPTSAVYLAYDVSVFAGMRGDARVFGRLVAAELWFQHRYNFLFQNRDYGYSRLGAFDQRNVTVKLAVY